MFTEEVGVSPLRVDGGAGYRARVADLVRAGQSLAWIERGEVLFKAESARCPAALPGAGRLGGAAHRGRGIGPPARPPSSSTPARDRAGGQPLRQRLQRARPGPPTRGSGSARSGRYASVLF
jgi:hypothetical protein